MIRSATPTQRAWLGELPDGWSSPRLRRLAIIRNGRDHKHVEVPEGGYPVYGSGGKFARASSSLHPGPSVLLGRKGTIDNPQYADEPFWTVDTSFYTEIANDVNPRFFYYVALTIPYDYFEAGTALPSMTQSNLYSVRCPLPPLVVQKRIADHLDSETARIDTLIDRKQRFIELLKEKRTTLITHAVTKGLEPAAEMADSGVDWIGNIPAHWRSMPLRRVTRSCCDGPFGSGLKAEHYGDAGVRVVRLGNIGEVAFKDVDRAFVSADHAATLGNHSVLPGDLLIAGLGDSNNLVGRACVSPDNMGPAMVKADCFRFRLTSGVLPTFMAYLLTGTAAPFALQATTGSTRGRVSLSRMMARPILLPPLSEQAAIVDHLVATTKTMQTLSNRTHDSIQLLLEYRSALISAAVTGQIEVGN